MPGGRCGAGGARGNQPLGPYHRGHRQQGSPADRRLARLRAATPLAETALEIGEALSDFAAREDRELTEVRWVSSVQTEELMGDMAEAVHHPPAELGFSSAAMIGANLAKPDIVPMGLESSCA
jgi:hypothetical protein